MTLGLRPEPEPEPVAVARVDEWSRASYRSLRASYSCRGTVAEVRAGSIGIAAVVLAGPCWVVGWGSGGVADGR